ncbi:hypothetical protein [Lysinibacillus boronitolerans]|uniref:hypothetical protein n=1 Tax=Lysinibacillus boronitolerans TaxID=309788 RepID=UPI0002E97CE4|nr:hypothetical protein [Lysinibacillus boronitolerans]
MNVIFIDSYSGEELLHMVSQDVAGILAAAQGESVTFPVGHFKYEFHNLDFYEDNGQIRQELVIYVKKNISDTLATA